MAEFLQWHETASGHFRWSARPGATSTVATGNALVGVPFWSGAGGNVNNLWLSRESGTGGNPAVSKIRLGIYTVNTPLTAYPTGLLSDGGEFSMDTTDIIAPVTTSMMPGQIYWLTYFTNISTPQFTPRAGNVFPGVFGFDSTLSSYQMSIVVSWAYGALPATFPASARANPSGPFFGVQFTS